MNSEDTLRSFYNVVAPFLRKLRYLNKADAAASFGATRGFKRQGETDLVGKTVLLVPFRVTPAAQWFEGVLSHAFKQRGFRPISIFCGQAVKRCEQFVVTENAARACALCNAEAHAYVKAFALEAAWPNTLVSSGQRESFRALAAQIPLDDLATYTYRGINVGRQVMASLSRYLLRGEVDLRDHQSAAREYLYTALLTAEAAFTVIEQYRPRLAIMSHGIYATWGTFLDVCRERNVPAVVWGLQYRKHCFVFAHNRSYHHDFVEEPNDIWEHLELTPEQQDVLFQYLDQKGKGPCSADYISYYKDDEHPANSVFELLNLDPTRPRVGLFPNLSWDAQIAYGAPVFSSMDEWIVETVRWFASHRDRDLVIRAHPAETRGVYITQETVADILRKSFPSLPPNVFYVASDGEITSYQVSEIIDGALVYGTKFGLELVLRRKPVLVAGDAYYRSKGFTFDAYSKDEYFRYLEAMPAGTPVTDEMYERAVRYGYHFNFRRMYPLPLAELNGTQFVKFFFDDVSELAPGRNPQLDDFIDRCLTGKPFVYEGS